MRHLHQKSCVLLACIIGSICAHTRAADLPAIDFSTAGYGGGGVALPDTPVVLTLRPSGADDTTSIQAAIDAIAAMPEDKRGALLLAAGEFHVAGKLVLSDSGLVLRGMGESATKIIATGQSRRTLIDARAATTSITAPAIAIREDVPVGSTLLPVESVDTFAIGKTITVRRPCTPEWIRALGMNTATGNFVDMRLHWLPDSRVLRWDRTITAIDPSQKTITLDAPITTALEKKYGTATVSLATAPTHHVGIENLTLDSAFDAANPRDEEHAWIAIALDNVEDAWVWHVTARHFAASAVRVGPHGRRITIEACKSEQPVSEIGGYRRDSFWVEGQQVLVRGCTSEAGIDDFALGLCAAGPNVFLDCTTKGSLGASGAYESWASGALYENVTIDGAPLRITYDMTRSQGAGWTAANSVLWNCTATAMEAKGPEGVPNFIRKETAPLYAAQLQARGKTLPPITDIKTAAANAREFQPAPRASATPTLHPLTIEHGYFVVDKKVVWGGEMNEGWWRGQANPATAVVAGGFSITRFVPGRDGPGLTEILPDLAARMVKDNMPFAQTGPGLWYDRRRDEHSITERMDGDVWAPFYEMPWERSGKEKAWDGLSKFDLTKPNAWYYDRTIEFARLAQQNGLVVVHNLYNTHNVLEIPPHWIDYPWRPANNINDTGPTGAGLPEPPPIEGGTKLHVGNQFYSVENEKLRALHRQFILRELDAVGDQPNVLVCVGFQFVGPLAFEQFFIDTAAEWEKAHGKHVKIALATTKDITDAILQDPVRSRLVTSVDMRYWQYKPDGSLYAPAGGQNLAFRELNGGKDYPPPTTPEQAYRQVREYRDKYPALALVAWNNDVGPMPALMAGASQVLLRNPAAGHGQGTSIDRHPTDTFVRTELTPILTTLSPRDNVVWSFNNPVWCLADEKLQHVLMYSAEGETMTLYAGLPGKAYTALWINPSTAETRPFTPPAKGFTEAFEIQKPDTKPWMLWVKQAAP